MADFRDLLEEQKTQLLEMSLVWQEIKLKVIEHAWLIIANVDQGEWNNQSEEWRGEAARWRDNYYASDPDAETRLRENDRDELIERLADEAHQAWCGWMEYMFKQGLSGPVGQFTINKESVKRWQRQMITPYAQLPESEKESDRKEARRYLELFEGKDRGVE